MRAVLKITLAATLACLAQGCLLRSTLASATQVDGSRELRDLAYWAGPDFDDAKHRLNVFVPPGPGPHPVIVFAHGGGWFFGDRAEATDPYTKLGRRFAARGILTVVISYRLSPAHQHPAHIQDVARAIAWTFDHIATHGGDSKRIFLMGHSAGAQLMSLAACDPTWLEAHGRRPSDLAGVIAISAPYDVNHLGRSLFTRLALVKPAFGASEQTWRAASPASHLRAALPPPFFVAWADGDPEILRRHAAAFSRSLERRGVAVQRFEAPFKGHFSVITDLGEPGDALGDEVERYVKATSRTSRPGGVAATP